MTEKFKEDKAESLLNTKNLEKEFGIESTDNTKKYMEELKDLRNELESAEEVPDAEGILKSNIDRANRLLDKIEDEITNGQINARLFEVSSQLINSITSATASITGNIFSDQKHEYNMRMLEVKEKDLAIKHALMGGGTSPSSSSGSNLLVTDRESLLALLNGEDEYVNSEPNDEDDKEV